jgi:NADPH:quinone reductase-like Zn-dependent oxidoreductase
MADIPKTTKQWTVTGTNGFDALKLSEEATPQVGDSQVLVKLHAASLNYRDLVIPKGMYPFAVIDNVIPGSDGAGTVLAVGKDVQRFKPGDKVVTAFHQHYVGGLLKAEYANSSLGGSAHGVLRTTGVFHENGLVHMPEALNFREASTLSCAGLTAWNALFGLEGRKLAPGQWVLTQGTGGVSIFGVQFAKAAGARVIATTSSPEKAKLLEKLGADHIINYNEEPNWGSKAKELTGGVGVDHVIEVAGPKSMKQSLASIRPDGVISIIGFVGGPPAQDQPGFLDCLTNLCIARGIFVGSRTQMEDMCRAIEANPEALRPVVDSKTFKFEDLKDAYEYQWSGKHQAKVVVDIE